MQFVSSQIKSVQQNSNVEVEVEILKLDVFSDSDVWFDSVDSRFNIPNMIHWHCYFQYGMIMFISADLLLDCCKL